MGDIREYLETNYSMNVTNIQNRIVRQVFNTTKIKNTYGDHVRFWQGINCKVKDSNYLNSIYLLFNYYKRHTKSGLRPISKRVQYISIKGYTNFMNEDDLDIFNNSDEIHSLYYYHIFG